jgi:hypothetical protein
MVTTTAFRVRKALQELRFISVAFFKKCSRKTIGRKPVSPLTATRRSDADGPDIPRRTRLPAQASEKISPLQPLL